MIVPRFKKKFKPEESKKSIKRTGPRKKKSQVIPIMVDLVQEVKQEKPKRALTARLTNEDVRDFINQLKKDGISDRAELETVVKKMNDIVTSSK